MKPFCNFNTVVLLISLVFAPVSVLAVDYEASDYFDPCRIVVSMSMAMVQARSKDEGMSKAEALEIFLLVIEGEDVNSEVNQRDLRYLDEVYGKYSHLRSDDIMRIYWKQCIETAEKNGRLQNAF